MEAEPSRVGLPSGEPDVDANGVDRAQIRAMLRLTPEQRLRAAEEFIESALEIRELNAAASVVGDQARSSLRIGSRRMRFPVAAKIALHTAGAMGGTPGSPQPVGAASLCTMCTSTVGISFMRSTS
jgi:hypothetical protein